ncbi:MAG: hypothetical protein KAW67_06280, partial [Candidatus Eisenbacteria sp.]|nr:hypothetical protein [Candidatus Eisenbacteria bacterium]
MTGRSLVLVTALALTVLPSLAAAQHSYGDGFGIGGVLLPSGSPILLGTTRIGDSLGLEFSVALNVQDDGSSSETVLGAGIGVKKYLTDRKQFQPFMGGRFGFHHYSRSSDNGRNDVDDTRFGVTAVLGGEYFITRKLSVESELEFNLYFGS